MSKLVVVRPPQKFVSLHSHSGFSAYDGLGYPDAHISFVTSEAQGMDAWALTDHGNGNGLAHAHSAAVKLQKKGVKYRQLYGVEFYFVPSLSQWKVDYEAHKSQVRDAKAEKKSVKADSEDEEQGGHIVEDESETKGDTYKEKPEWQRRYHLVAVAKNYEGLANINRLVKASFKDGFYRYPRIDFDLIRKWGKGIIWSTACVGGTMAGTIVKGEKFGKSRDEILRDLEELCGKFVEAADPNSFFLELQFNKLDIQHKTNSYLIELSKKTNIPLISTCDSHYPDPTKWEARELYKKLGWMGSKFEQSDLPKFEDLKCELYPKNAAQMWEEYKKSFAAHPEVYEGTEEVVRDSIERTHDITWGMCEDTWIDTNVKLPKLDKVGNSSFKQLTKLVMAGLEREGLADKKEYVDRALYELGDIKYLKQAPYFVTMYNIFNIAKENTLLGCGRGSGAGCLVNYLLGITQIDPIPYTLLFTRFMGRHRCLEKDTLIDTESGPKKISELSLGDNVLTARGTYEKVIDKEDNVEHDVNVVIKTSREKFSCSPNHKWLVKRGNEVSEIMTCDLKKGDKLLFKKSQ